jgi:hypothetical protein
MMPRPILDMSEAFPRHLERRARSKLDLSTPSIPIQTAAYHSVLSEVEHFHACLQNMVNGAVLVGLVNGLKQFDVVKVCKHPKKIRFLFRNDLYEFLRCEGCGQIVRLPL